MHLMIGLHTYASLVLVQRQGWSARLLPRRLAAVAPRRSSSHIGLGCPAAWRHLQALRCCGHPLDQKCNDLTGDAACPTHVEAARRLRAKVAKQHVLGSGQSRPHSPHSPVPQILYWSRTERISWSLDCLSSQAGRPRRKRPHRSGAMCRVRWSGAASGARPRHVRGPVWSEWSAAFQRCKKRAKY